MRTGHLHDSALAISVETIVDWLRHRGAVMYGGESVTQLEHALQCATIAMAEGASSSLITAALLHDLGHLADGVADATHPHEVLAAEVLTDLFGAAVTEPIRMHVDAKRFLCVADPLYWSDLSPASKQSLVWQGGPFSIEHAVEFIALPYADDAVRLRRWDDAAKVAGATTPALEAFIGIMQSAIRRSLPIEEANQ